jgi:hypothetical protein
MNRLQEPDEMTVFRRYRDVGAAYVKSTYGPTGLLKREVTFPWGRVPAAIAADYEEAESLDLDLQEAERLRSIVEQEAARERALARLATRLPDRQGTAWDALTGEERRILLLSNKDYASFRARGANPRDEAGQNPPQEEEN